MRNARRKTKINKQNYEEQCDWFQYEKYKNATGTWCVPQTIDVNHFNPTLSDQEPTIRDTCGFTSITKYSNYISWKKTLTRSFAVWYWFHLVNQFSSCAYSRSIDFTMAPAFDYNFDLFHDSNWSIDDKRLLVTNYFFSFDILNRSLLCRD